MDHQLPQEKSILAMNQESRHYHTVVLLPGLLVTYAITVGHCESKRGCKWFSLLYKHICLNWR